MKMLPATDLLQADRARFPNERFGWRLLVRSFVENGNNRYSYAQEFHLINTGRLRSSVNGAAESGTWYFTLAHKALTTQVMLYLVHGKRTDDD